jgi:hypothetical protein
MKKIIQTKIAKLLILLLISTISLFLWNCEKEEVINSYNEQNVNNSSYFIRSISYNEVVNNSVLQKKMQLFNNEYKNAASKETSSTNYNFTINKEQGKYLESQDGYHSYTFLVERTEYNGYLENILFSLQPDGEYKTFLIKYKLSAEELININLSKEIFFNDEKVIYEVLEDDNLLNVFSKDQSDELDDGTPLTTSMCMVMMVKYYEKEKCKGADLLTCSTPGWYQHISCST